MSAQRTQGRQRAGELDDVVSVAQGRSVGDWIKLGLGTLAAISLVLFLFQNTQDVEVNFLWFEWNTRMIFALLAATIVGIIGAVAFSTIRGMRRGKTQAPPK